MKNAFILASVAAAICLAAFGPQIANAFNFSNAQSGTPYAGLSSAAYAEDTYGIVCNYGSCYYGSPQPTDWYNSKSACDAVAWRSGQSPGGTYTCSYERTYEAVDPYNCIGIAGSCAPIYGVSGITYVSVRIYPGTGYGLRSGCERTGSNITPLECTTYTHAPAPPPVPPPPTGLYHVCNAAGTQVTLYWNAAPGAWDYYVRLYGAGAYAGYNDYYGGTAITYNISPNTYYDWWVHSRNGTGYSAPSYGSFVCSGLPNLYSVTGGSITVIAGQVASLTGATYNNGNNTASGSFYDLFLIYDSGYNYSSQNGSTYWAHTDPVWSGAIGAGGGVSRVGYYRFNNVGTFYYRLCADWNGGVSELNEGDNCGGLVQVNVIPPIPPQPTGLYHVCNAGGTQVTLYWNAMPGAVDYYVRLYDGISANPYTGYAGYTDFYPGTSITYNTVPGRYHDWWVHSRNGTGHSAPSYGSFTCVGYPDLVAGGTSASQTIPNRSTTLSAVASNVSGGSSGGFPMLFQIADAAISYTIGYAQSGYASLAPGQSTTMTANYTFPAGTYAVRACANYNTAWQAITSESNYGNNCGAWSTVTFQNTGSLTCTVPSNTAKVGDTVTYTASPSGGAGAPYSWNDSQGGSYGSSSSASRTFTALGNYAMSVGADNTIQPSYSCTTPNGSNFITVGCAAPHTASVSAAATRVRQGQSTTLTWSGQGINTSCVLSGPNVSQTTPANTCSVPTQTTSTGALSTQSRYCVTCDGTAQQCVTVNVVPLYEEF